MTDTSQAKIYLADERGVKEDDSFRSYRTFNFENFINEHKTPFGDLYVLNDESLAGGCSVSTTVDVNSLIILLPIVGAVSYKDDLGHTGLINAGEIQMIDLAAGSGFEISNPYESELVNYLEFRVATTPSKNLSAPLILGFDLELHENNLIELVNSSTSSEQNLKLSIGQFRGREEAIYRLNNNNSKLFIFIVEGAFEVQGRLLHPRDGLALWDVEGQVELEALSNEAIVLVVELKI